MGMLNLILPTVVDETITGGMNNGRNTHRVSQYRGNFFR